MATVSHAQAQMAPVIEPKDCIVDAAAYHGVNSLTLRAIGWFESKLTPIAVGKNSNATQDIGAFQTNTIHLEDLRKAGVSRQALEDGCVSAYVAAGMYRQHINAIGNTWLAVGYYHSKTPERARWYANQIFLILQKWRAIDRSTEVPFPGYLVRPPIGRSTQAPRAQQQTNASQVVVDTTQ